VVLLSECNRENNLKKREHFNQNKNKILQLQIVDKTARGGYYIYSNLQKYKYWGGKLNMKIKKLIVLGAAVSMFTASTLGVSASGLKDVFDAEYYAEQYPDLKEAFGDDEKALYNHFLKYGLKEGRNMSPILDVVAYREAYGDLDAAFGDNWDAYVEHFLTFGAYEKRDEGVLFNPVEYAAAYSDISAAFGNDLKAITNHYKTNGRSENRTEGTSEGYSSIAAKVEAEEKAAQEEESSRPGVGAEVMDKARILYWNAGNAYIVYVNTSESAKSRNDAASAYNISMNLFENYRAQILKDGTQAELDELHVIMQAVWDKAGVSYFDGLPATLSTVSEEATVEAATANASPVDNG
jgi:hypothetical protein